MYTLYYRPTCPYCLRVLAAAKKHGIELTLKDVSSDPAVADELIATGGKHQVPFLVVNTNNVSMYESADIIDYLINNHTNK